MKKLTYLGILLLITTHAFSKEWYEGGTLHSKSALDWQQSTYENKLATCSDFISQIWQKNGFVLKLQKRIKSLDEVKTLSIELMKALDAAFEKEPNEEKNRKLYTNQKVASTAAILMMTMGWVE